MGLRCPLPMRSSVRDLLADLLDREIKVDRGALQVLEEGRAAFAASYIRDDGAPAAVCVCDLSLAVGSGAAIGMVPPAAASAEAAAGELVGDTEEFFREVVNVLAKLLNSPTTPHVRLDAVYTVPGEVPAAVAAVVLAPAERADYRVAIDGYGVGRMTLLVG